MSREEPRPRGPLLRSSIAAALFGAAVLPGWLLAELVESWTGWTAVGWLLSSAWTGAATFWGAGHVSLRRRDAAWGLVPLLGWYVVCVVAWRLALLPLRDWEPRADELWRARWLTGPEHAGMWRADRLRTPVARHSTVARR
jgi:hypothetical protein